MARFIGEINCARDWLFKTVLSVTPPIRIPKSKRSFHRSFISMTVIKKEAEFSSAVHHRTYHPERKFKTHLSHVSSSSSLDRVSCVSQRWFARIIYKTDFVNRDSRFRTNAIAFPFLPSRRVSIFPFITIYRLAILRMITKKAADRWLR